MPLPHDVSAYAFYEAPEDKVVMEQYASRGGWRSDGNTTSGYNIMSGLKEELERNFEQRKRSGSLEERAERTGKTDKQRRKENARAVHVCEGCQDEVSSGAHCGCDAT